MVFLLVYGAAVATQNELEVTVKPIEGLGMGAFAAEPAEAGRWVCAYHGKLVTKEDVELRYPDEPPKYLFELDDTYSLGAQDSEHVSRSFNHHEFGTMVVTRDEAARRIDFYTARDVAVGEELTFDCAPQPLSRALAAISAGTVDASASYTRIRPQTAWPTGKDSPSTRQRAPTAGATLCVGY